MGKTPRKHTAQLKANVVIEVLKGELDLAQICSKYEIHATQVRRWTEIVLSGMSALFSEQPNDIVQEKEELIDELYKEIGQLKVELDWLKKKMGTFS